MKKSDKEWTEHTRICINIYHQSNTEKTHQRIENTAISPNRQQHKEKNENNAGWNNCVCVSLLYRLFFFKPHGQKLADCCPLEAAQTTEPLQSLSFQTAAKCSRDSSNSGVYRCESRFTYNPWEQCSGAPKLRRGKKSAFLWDYTGYCVSELGHRELQDGSRFRAWTPGAEWRRTSMILLMGWFIYSETYGCENWRTHLQPSPVSFFSPNKALNWNKPAVNCTVIPQSLLTLTVLQASFIYS